MDFSISVGVSTAHQLIQILISKYRFYPRYHSCFSRLHLHAGMGLAPAVHWLVTLFDFLAMQANTRTMYLLNEAEPY